MGAEKGYLEIITGSNTGGILITGTTAVTGSFEAIVVNEDAIFDELVVDEVDVTAARGFTGETLSAGMFIGAGNRTGSHIIQRARITSIKLTSGSVVAY